MDLSLTEVVPYPRQWIADAKALHHKRRYHANSRYLARRKAVEEYLAKIAEWVFADAAGIAVVKAMEDYRKHDFVVNGYKIGVRFNDDEAGDLLHPTYKGLEDDFLVLIEEAEQDKSMRIVGVATRAQVAAARQDLELDQPCYIVPREELIPWVTFRDQYLVGVPA